MATRELSPDQVRKFLGEEKLTTAEVAAQLGCGRTAVLHLIRGGELFAVRVGADYRIPRSAVEEYVVKAAVDDWIAVKRSTLRVPRIVRQIGEQS